MGLHAGINCYSLRSKGYRVYKRKIHEYDLSGDEYFNEAFLRAATDYYGPMHADLAIPTNEAILDTLAVEFAADDDAHPDEMRRGYQGAHFYIDLVKQLRKRLAKDQRIEYWCG
jgi:hypothetical protein